VGALRIPQRRRGVFYFLAPALASGYLHWSDLPPLRPPVTMLFLQLKPPAIIGLIAQFICWPDSPIWIKLALLLTVTPPETVEPQSKPDAFEGEKLASFAGRFWTATLPWMFASTIEKTLESVAWGVPI
jgi:hypothetical protein